MLPMNHKELCAILKACVKFNVKVLEYQGLKVTFFDPVMDNNAVITRPPIRDPELLKSKIRQVDQETLDKQEFQVKEDMLDQMLIEDPASYERLLLEKDLEDGDGRRDEDSGVESAV